MEDNFTFQLNQIRSMDKSDPHEFLKLVCDYPKEKNEKYNWVGIYILEENELRLETFVGRPTEHIQIPIGEGLCGQAIVKGSVINESDVKSNTEYLACSIETNSELVVPISFENKLTGEIDIDSDFKSAFSEDDENFLLYVAQIVSESTKKCAKE